MWGRALLLGLVPVTACMETTDPPVRDAGVIEASTEIPDASHGAMGFDPAEFPTDCEKDAECMLVTPIRQCGSCCSGDTAVNRKAAEDAYVAAEKACRTKGLAACTLGCPQRSAACVEARCVLRENDGGL